MSDLNRASTSLSNNNETPFRCRKIYLSIIRDLGTEPRAIGLSLLLAIACCAVFAFMQKMTARLSITCFDTIRTGVSGPEDGPRIDVGGPLNRASKYYPMDSFLVASTMAIEVLGWIIAFVEKAFILQGDIWRVYISEEQGDFRATTSSRSPTCTSRPKGSADASPTVVRACVEIEELQYALPNLEKYAAASNWASRTGAAKRDRPEVVRLQQLFSCISISQICVVRC
ncbi:hypothetical protein VTL71DRAFT_16064 [Oculimacula yallundae]|uniref:Uncharacterized protein n=1 Tax=Oculimacula yallundae TaxID=86028 RepID=A0ABR4CFH6_9HELO